MSREYRYQRLETWLLEGIAGKRWGAGDRLPSVREMCVEQQLSKATVLHAYQRLEARGLVEARPKSGYFVLPNLVSRAAPLIDTSAVVAPAPVTVSDVVMDVMSRGAVFDILAGQQVPRGSNVIGGKKIQLISIILRQLFLRQVIRVSPR
jgi:DNA-binding transcriptional MocR family regulator